MNSIRLFVAIVLFSAANTFAAEGVFLDIDGIQGEVVIKGREGWVRVFAINHEVVSPRDPATGQATGKRQHMPLRVVIPHDNSFPRLVQALTENRTIPSIVVNFFRPSALTPGAEVLYMKYELTNASITSVRPWMPNTKDASATEFGTQVEVAIVYQSIRWTYTNGGATHEDTWSTPR